MIKKVLLLSDASAVHTKRWQKAYEMIGWDVSVASFEKSLYEFKKFEKIEPKFSGRFKYAGSYLRLKEIVNKVKPDLILPHFIPNYGLLSFFEKIRKKIPYVLTIWGSDLLLFPLKNRLKKLIAKIIIDGASGVVVDAKFMKEILVENFDIRENKIIVIPFGVERKWREKGRNKKIGNEKPGIITYRKMEPLYNQEIIIKALKKFSDQERRGFYVDWVGAGSLSSKFKEMIYNEGLFDIVNYNGYVTEEELQSLLLKNQIYLSSSFSDGTSVSLIEAMSFGLFPVVSDIKGNREWIVDGINGFLFDPRSFKELHFKLKKALKDKDLRARACLLNKKIVEEKANWEDNILTFKNFVLKNL